MCYGLNKGNGFLLMKDKVTDILYICSAIKSGHNRETDLVVKVGECH